MCTARWQLRGRRTLTNAGTLLPIVLAPGLLCDERLWAEVQNRLEGPSSIVSLLHADSLDAMADAILAAASRRCVLAGFSMGAMAVMLVAARAPAWLAGIAVCATHAEADNDMRVAARLDQIAAAEADRFAALVATLPDLYFADPVAAEPSARLVVAMAEAQGPACFVRQVRAILRRPDLAAVARRIGVRAEVLCGGNDRIAPPALNRRLAALIPGAVLTVIPACGHMLPLEAPDAVAGILNSLARGKAA